ESEVGNKNVVIEYIVKNRVKNNIAIAESEPVFANGHSEKYELLSEPVDEEQETFGAKASNIHTSVQHNRKDNSRSVYAASVTSKATRRQNAIAATRKEKLSTTSSTHLAAKKSKKINASEIAGTSSFAGTLQDNGERKNVATANLRGNAEPTLPKEITVKANGNIPAAAPTLTATNITAAKAATDKRNSINAIAAVADKPVSMAGATKITDEVHHKIATSKALAGKHTAAIVAVYNSLTKNTVTAHTSLHKVSTETTEPGVIKVSPSATLATQVATAKTMQNGSNMYQAGTTEVNTSATAKQTVVTADNKKKKFATSVAKVTNSVTDFNGKKHNDVLSPSAAVSKSGLADSKAVAASAPEVNRTAINSSNVKTDIASNKLADGKITKAKLIPIKSASNTTSAKTSADVTDVRSNVVTTNGRIVVPVSIGKSPLASATGGHKQLNATQIRRSKNKLIVNSGIAGNSKDMANITDVTIAQTANSDNTISDKTLSTSQSYSAKVKDKSPHSVVPVPLVKNKSLVQSGAVAAKPVSPKPGNKVAPAVPLSVVAQAKNKIKASAAATKIEALTPKQPALASPATPVLAAKTELPKVVNTFKNDTGKFTVKPAADTTATATAKNDTPSKPVTFYGFNISLKAGYEGGFNSDASKKFVLSAALDRRLNNHFSVMLQPSLKISTLSAHQLAGTQSFYSLNNDSKVTFVDSFFIPVVDQYGNVVDVMERRNYGYTETHDSVVKSYSTGGSYAEIELPLLLKYNITKKISVYGGLNVTFSKLMSVNENTFKSDPISVSKDTFTFAHYTANPVAAPPVSAVIRYNGTPLGSYNGPLYPAQSGSLFRLGYMLGFSYEIKKKWMIDALIQQSSVKMNVVGGYDINKALSTSYFRITLGYKLFK
ncbi:MAG: hypothetical protein H7257_01870, partial [Taibaiella sp.]|nr:hypothetical protein [Taibaiella sp.]